MTRKKELKLNPELSINLFDIVALFCPGDKAPYYEFFIKLIKSEITNRKKNTHISYKSSNVKDYLNLYYNVPKEKMEHISDFHLNFAVNALENIFTRVQLNNIINFFYLHHNNKLEQRDLSKIKDLNELVCEVGKYELKALKKDLEKQIKKIHEDEEWLIIRPLTQESAIKYGYGTKWCTTTYDDDRYFTKHAGNGILIYALNKKTEFKMGIYRELSKIFHVSPHFNGYGEHEPFNEILEFSFWNAEGDCVSKENSGIPGDIMNIIMDEINNHPFANIKVENPNANRYNYLYRYTTT